MMPSNSKLVFREVEQSDLPTFGEIFNENILAGDATLWQNPFTLEDLQELHSTLGEREKMFVAAHGDQVIGIGFIKKYHPKKGYDYACDTSVFLRRNQLRKGYGTQFKQFILAECRRLNYHHAVAKILATNQASINYNLKQGYEMVGIQKEIGRCNDQWVDVAILQYIFSENE